MVLFAFFFSFCVSFAHYLLHVNIAGLAVGTLLFLSCYRFGDTEIKMVHIQFMALDMSVMSSFDVSLKYF